MQEQKRIVNKNPEPRRGLSDSLGYVSKSWFPINNILLKEIKDRLDKGEYQGNSEELVQDIKGDFSLYTWCLKALGTEIEDPTEANRRPTELLNELELVKFKELLNSPSDEFTTHTFNPADKPQLQRIRHTLVSCSTAEVLAEKTDVDPDFVFSIATIRQLGLNLIAWNYPRIYSKALGAMASEEKTLEQILFRLLGYSPLQLGMKASLGWNSNSEIQMALGLEQGQFGNSVELDPSDDCLVAMKCCEIGETLARINDPEHYPEAGREWDNVVKEINEYLGPKGMTVLKERITESSTGYQSLSPEMFKGDITPEKNLKRAADNYATKLLDLNNYALKCHQELQQIFIEVYRRMSKGQVSVDAINHLVSALVPASGFTRGCVYLVDSRKMTLIPSLRIGDRELSAYKPLSCLTSNGHTHPVVEALNYSMPVRQDSVVINGERVSHVSGTFGTIDKMGVLFLEIGPGLIGTEPHVPLQLFKAIRHCLADCLNLSGGAFSPK